jgi:hypothetical protein
MILPLPRGHAAHAYALDCRAQNGISAHQKPSGLLISFRRER